MDADAPKRFGDLRLQYIRGRSRGCRSRPVRLVHPRRSSLRAHLDHTLGAMVNDLLAVNVLNGARAPVVNVGQGKCITALFWGSSGRNGSVDLAAATTLPSDQSTNPLPGARVGEPPYAPVRRLPATGPKLEVDPRMTESSDTSDLTSRYLPQPRGRRFESCSRY
jgi:hypothetical protein